MPNEAQQRPAMPNDPQQRPAMPTKAHCDAQRCPAVVHNAQRCPAVPGNASNTTRRLPHPSCAEPLCTAAFAGGSLGCCFPPGTFRQLRTEVE